MYDHHNVILASDPAALICGEHPGQAGGEHPRDVGHGQDRGRLDLWGEAGRHNGPSPLPHPVPEPAPGRETIQRPAGRTDTQVSLGYIYCISISGSFKHTDPRIDQNSFAITGYETEIRISWFVQTFS